MLIFSFRFFHPSKLLTALLVFIVLLGFNTHSVQAACETASFAGGSGTIDDPWQIATPTQLASLSDCIGADYDDSYFRQTQNIDLDVSPYNTGTGWTPIGTIDDPFQGQYDGNGYTIANLEITQDIFETLGDSPESYYLGLFGNVLDAELLNIHLTSASLTGAGEIGALAGRMYTSKVYNSSSTGTIAGRLRVGGLIGFSSSSEIYDSSSAANINIRGTQTSAGGTETQRSYQHGGLIGLINSTEAEMFISRSYATGDLSVIDGGAKEQTGGFIGGNWAEDLIIRDSYARGDVEGGSFSIGGFVGRGAYSTAEIYSSYSTGSVTGTTDSQEGGFVGGAYSATRYTGANNFWDTQTSGQASSGGPGETGKTTAQMKDIDTFTDTATVGLDEAWDFDAVWNIDGSVNNGYPFLRDSYTVTSSNSANGTIDPVSTQSKLSGSTATFSLTADDGYEISSVGGTCGGSITDANYTTASITKSCYARVLFVATESEDSSSESSSSSSNNSSSNSKSSSCTDIAPTQAPDLFQIDRNQGTATLFFTPISSSNQYFISYSTSPNAEEHGTLVTLSSDGVQSFTVDSISSSENYYFKVRGQKGCAPGGWSNIRQSITQSNPVEKPLVTNQDLNQTPVQKNQNKLPSEEESDKQEEQEISTPVVEEDNYTLTVTLKEAEALVEGIEVSLGNGEVKGITDESGKVVFKDVKPGKHQVHIVGQAYAADETIMLEGDEKEYDVVFNINSSENKLKMYGIFLGIFAVINVLLVMLLFRKRGKKE